MITAEEIHAILSKRFSQAEITVEDMTGTQDHFQVIMINPEFKGKSLIEQHQLVNQALREPLDDGRIHALKIKTAVPKN